MTNSLELWELTLSRLKEELDETSFNDLFSGSYEIHKVENDSIFVVVPNILTKYRIDKFHRNRINQIAHEVSSLPFEFICKEDATKEKEELAAGFLVNPSEDEIISSLSKRNLRPEYTFSNFVMGESNRFAFLSAMKVAETPQSLYNPLYIFGDVGLGKTHLMMAIGHYMLDNNKNIKVVYTSSQQFTEDYFISTSTKKGKESIENFYNYYRGADVLLVDDVQFLDGKTATQTEFFKVFEYLYENNKQIVITSDRPANDLKNMMTRLKSRFNWGLCVDIKAPNKELRTHILKRKLSFLISNVKEVPEEALDLIADYFPNNIRDLEGALRRYITYCVSLDIPFTYDNVYVALDSLLPKDLPGRSITPNEFKYIEDIKNLVSNYYHLSPKDLESSSRKQQLTYARQVAIYLIRNKYNTPLKKIGECFGSRDHATISHAFDKIEFSIKTNTLIKSDIEILTKMMENL
jgi:chromosomal replication initiator protein